MKEKHVIAIALVFADNQKYMYACICIHVYTDIPRYDHIHQILSRVENSPPSHKNFNR